jgi:SAM-dependent methyltransferase
MAALVIQTLLEGEEWVYEVKLEDLPVRMRTRVAAAVNRTLRPFNMELSQRGVDVPETVWDRQFRTWIREAAASGRDPNDIGDERWAEDLLDVGLKEHYLPYVTASSVILELGPGSGRLSRHLVGRCGKLIMVDSSPQVCDWIREYLQGRGPYRIHLIDGPFLPMIGNDDVDAAFSHGVAEHLDLDELYWFLTEFHRVLRPGGTVAFNFDNVMTNRGIEVLRQDGPRRRALFRVHHPESIRRVASVAGFAEAEVFDTPGRIAFAQLRKR